MKLDEPSGREDDDRCRKVLTNPGKSVWQKQMQLYLLERMGVDLASILGIGVETALTLYSEVDWDFSKFSSAKHICQWLRLAPGTHLSGGKRLSKTKQCSTHRAGQALRMAAMSLRNGDNMLAYKHRQRCVRMDTLRVTKATVHQLARIIYAMVFNQREYEALMSNNLKHSERTKRFSA